jgi:hypothetical protein
MPTPQQNRSPLPRITTTRSSGAAGARSTSVSSQRMSRSRALRYSARFNQMVFTGPLCSMMTLLTGLPLVRRRSLPHSHRHFHGGSRARGLPALTDGRLSTLSVRLRHRGARGGRHHAAVSGPAADPEARAGLPRGLWSAAVLRIGWPLIVTWATSIFVRRRAAVRQSPEPWRWRLGPAQCVQFSMRP